MNNLQIKSKAKLDAFEQLYKAAIKQRKSKFFWNGEMVSTSQAASLIEEIRKELSL